VDVETVATTLALAEQNHAEELKRVCLDFVSKHLAQAGAGSSCSAPARFGACFGVRFGVRFGVFGFGPFGLVRLGWGLGDPPGRWRRASAPLSAPQGQPKPEPEKADPR
jgi:hypothetical protein